MQSTHGQITIATNNPTTPIVKLQLTKSSEVQLGLLRPIEDKPDTTMMYAKVSGSGRTFFQQAGDTTKADIAHRQLVVPSTVQVSANAAETVTAI